MKNTAFTLAEVLITLGIIGVVAAMTLPGLIQNYQKKVYVNQLKKSVNVIENGFRRMLAEDGVDKLYDTEPFKGFINKPYQNYNNSKIKEGIKQYFNLLYTRTEYNNAKAYSYNIEDNGTFFPDFILTDGVAFTINNDGDSQTASYYPVTLDINGSKGPNEYGRDIHEFALLSNAKLVPYLGKRYLEYTTTEYSDEEMDNMVQNAMNRYCRETVKVYCTIKLIEIDNWEMLY